MLTINKYLVIVVLILILVVATVSADVYSPNYVKLHFVHMDNSSAAGNVTISENPVSSDYFWVFSMIGLSQPNVTPRNVTYSTNNEGALIIPMVRFVMYNISFSNQTNGEMYMYKVYPYKFEYTFIVGELQTISTVTGVSPLPTSI
jgi:hypothetical protein